MQLTDSHHAHVPVFVPDADILNTLGDCGYQFVFSILDKRFTPCLMQQVMF